MNEDFSCSEKTSSLMAALSSVAKAALKPHKNANNPHFKSKYADLECVLDTVRDQLVTHDLTITQMPLGGVEVCRLLVRVSHSSNEWLQWIFTTPVSKKDPQGIGAAITYLRRFSLVSVFNMVDSDDDGNHASTAPEQTGWSGSDNDYTDTQKSKSPVQKAPASPYEQGKQAGQQKQYAATPGKAISEKQLKFLFVKMKQSGFSDVEVGEYITKRFGVHSKNELDQPQFNVLLAALEDKDLTVGAVLISGNDRSHGFDEMNVPF